MRAEFFPDHEAEFVGEFDEVAQVGLHVFRSFVRPSVRLRVAGSSLFSRGCASSRDDIVRFSSRRKKKEENMAASIKIESRTGG